MAMRKMRKKEIKEALTCICWRCMEFTNVRVQGFRNEGFHGPLY
jgi:hypothetical protein